MSHDPSPDAGKVAVVIPTRDRSAFLATAIVSLLSQTHRDWEAVVVDDGSAPGELAEIARLCSSDPRIRLMRNPGPRTGACACRNLGFAASTAPFVVFLDSDDSLAPYCLANRVQFLAGRPELDFATYPLWNFHRTPGDRTGLWNVFDASDDLERFFGEDAPWQTTGPIWRRRALERSGLWDARVRSSQDADLHLRVLIAGFRYEKVPTPDAYWRLPGSGPSIGARSEIPVFVFNRIRMFLRNATLLQDSGGLTGPRRAAAATQLFRHAFRKTVPFRAAAKAWTLAHRRGIVSPREYRVGLALVWIEQATRGLVGRGIAGVFCRGSVSRSLGPGRVAQLASRLVRPLSGPPDGADRDRAGPKLMRRVRALRLLGSRLRRSGNLTERCRRVLAIQYFRCAFRNGLYLRRRQILRIWRLGRQQGLVSPLEYVAALGLDVLERATRRLAGLGIRSLFPRLEGRGRYGFHEYPALPATPPEAAESAATGVGSVSAPSPVPLDDYLAVELPFKGALRRLMRGRDPVIFDIGSCEAEDSIRYSRLFPSARIYAFEPLPENQAIIRANLQRYGARQVLLVPKALAARSGPAQFNVSTGAPPELFSGRQWNYGNKSSSLLLPRSAEPMHGWIEFKRTVEVECTTMDAFCEQENLPGADYLHIDVQGAEFQVLQGADRTIRRARCIWIETADEEVYAGQEPRSVISRWLRRRGFVCAYRRTNGIESDCLFVNLRHPAALAYWLRQRLRGAIHSH